MLSSPEKNTPSGIYTKEGHVGNLFTQKGVFLIVNYAANLNNPYTNTES